MFKSFAFFNMFAWVDFGRLSLVCSIENYEWNTTKKLRVSICGWSVAYLGQKPQCTYRWLLRPSTGRCKLLSTSNMDKFCFVCFSSVLIWAWISTIYHYHCIFCAKQKQITLDDVFVHTAKQQSLLCTLCITIPLKSQHIRYHSFVTLTIE